MRIHTIVLWKLILFMILDVVWLASSPTKFEKPFKCQNVQLFQEIIACVYFFSVFHTFGNIQLFLQNFSYWSFNYQNVQLFKLFHFCTFQLFNFSAFSDIQLMKKIIVGTKWENLQILFKTHRLSTSSFCLFSSVHTFSFRAVLKILLTYLFLKPRLVRLLPISVTCFYHMSLYTAWDLTAQLCLWSWGPASSQKVTGPSLFALHSCGTPCLATSDRKAQWLLLNLF